MSALKESIAAVGGVTKASLICGVSPRAIYKWITADSLPRTDYTGETDYAVRLAKASDGKFASEWLLSEAAPNKSAA